VTLTELNERLCKWHVNKYGKSDVDMVRTALKTVEELGEAAKAILKRDWENAAEECCDVFFLILHLCRGLGVDLLEEAEKKLEVIERRLLK
jgi:NTP pyrophosphatase (non-canonical NTP hydrolase)